MIFGICIGLILGCVFLLALTMPIYCVEVGTAKVFFFSEKRAERFYNKQKDFYERCASIERDLIEIRKALAEVEATT